MIQEQLAQAAEALASRKARGPSSAKVVGSEFVTGALHEAWHGPQEPPSQVPGASSYTDSVLARVQAKESERNAQKERDDTGGRENAER